MNTTISLEQFPFQKIYDIANLVFLGQGSYGKVFKSKDLRTNLPVAIKQINMDVIRNENLEQALKSQIDLMKQIKSQNTVQLVDSYIGKKYAYMILELCDSDLRKKMQTNQNKLNEQDYINIFNGIMKGFKVLVQSSCIHRDIKPQNILLKGEKVKIADFGFAKKADMLAKIKYSDMCGTPVYMAPQILNNQPYTSKCDIWSLGLMLYEMIYGCPPWPLKSIEGYKEAIFTRPLSFPLNITAGRLAKDFLMKALVVDETKRMNWQEVYSHPLIKDKMAGQLIITKPVQPKLRLILQKMQDEAERKKVNQLQVFNKYKQHKTLTLKQFQELLKQLSPTITTYEINAIFAACDKNQNGVIQRDQFQQMFCTVNYRMDPQFSREIDQIVRIVQSKKIELSDLFIRFDKNKTGAIDNTQFRQLILYLAPQYPQNKIYNIYKKLDRNCSGLIEKKQFLQTIGAGLANQKNYIGILMEKASRNLSMFKYHLQNKKLTVDNILKLADSDYDKHITETEFLDLCHKIDFTISKEQIIGIFQMIDSNNSGNISMKELCQYLN